MPGAEVILTGPPAMNEDVPVFGSAPLAFDETDAQLVALLTVDGRIGNRTLAAELGISEATVGARIRRMTSQGILSFTTLIDWEAAGYEWFAIARVRVEGRTPGEVATDLADVPGCIVSCVVFGAVDVLAYFLLADRAEIHDLIGRHTARIKGIGHLDLQLATESHFTSFGGASFLSREPAPIRLPCPAILMDEVDVALLNQLMVDGRQSSRQIARELGVSEGTVRARMARLSQAKLMKPVVMFNPVAVGATGVVADVTMEVGRDRVARITKQLLKMPEVAITAVTVGRANLAIVVAASDRAELLDFVVNKIRSLDGVRSTQTLEMIDIVKVTPYFKRLN